MPSFSTLACLAMAASSTLAGFSPTFWAVVEGANAKAVINTYKTTLQVPPLPAHNKISLWPGQGANDFLIQSILGYGQSPCPSEKKWCAFSYVFKGGSGGSISQAQGTNVDPGDLVDITYTFDESTGDVKQVMTLQSTGAQLSTLTHHTGGGGTGNHDHIECHWNGTFDTPQHTYFNTSYVLSQPNPNFGSLVTQNNANAGTLTSSDGGTTWSISKITLKASSCKNPS